MPRRLATRFPNCFDTASTGELPSGWQITSLGAVVDNHGGFVQTGPFGSQLHAADYADEGVPVIMPQDMTRGRIDTAKIARVDVTHADRLQRHRVMEGDIVYSRRGDVGRYALIGKREAGWLCGTGCLLVRPGAKWRSPLYLALSLSQPITREWIVQHAIGATMPNLNTSILCAVPILEPDSAIVDVFEEIAGPFEKRIEAAIEESAILAELRDTLLPRLISGELRIKDAERWVREHV